MILVLEHGHLVERGTHQELLEADALYARLYNTQFSDRAPAEKQVVHDY
jgi:ABC-type multidrug transport system fused ATPase/permease subunit